LQIIKSNQNKNVHDKLKHNDNVRLKVKQMSFVNLLIQIW